MPPVFAWWIFWGAILQLPAQWAQTDPAGRRDATTGRHPEHDHAKRDQDQR